MKWPTDISKTKRHFTKEKTSLKEQISYFENFYHQIVSLKHKPEFQTDVHAVGPFIAGEFDETYHHTISFINLRIQ